MANYCFREIICNLVLNMNVNNVSASPVSFYQNTVENDCIEKGILEVEGVVFKKNICAGLNIYLIDVTVDKNTVIQSLSGKVFWNNREKANPCQDILADKAIELVNASCCGITNGLEIIAITSSLNIVIAEKKAQLVNTPAQVVDVTGGELFISARLRKLTYEKLSAHADIDIINITVTDIITSQHGDIVAEDCKLTKMEACKQILLINTSCDLVVMKVPSTTITASIMLEKDSTIKDLIIGRPEILPIADEVTLSITGNGSIGNITFTCKGEVDLMNRNTVKITGEVKSFQEIV